MSRSEMAQHGVDLTPRLLPETKRGHEIAKIAENAKDSAIEKAARPSNFKAGDDHA